MRHPLEGAPFVASLNANIPVINAGDGGHKHPTQTLADLLTIYKEKGRLNNLTVGFCGDLKYGRTVHSLLGALSRYTGIKVVLTPPNELKIPNYVKDEILDKCKMNYVETEDLESSLPSLDVLYMTRVQQERFADLDEYERLKDSYVLTLEKLNKAKKDTIVLHPLPRVNEISVQVDSDSRACYFKQTLNGKLMRMALILKLLNEQKKNPANLSKIEKTAVYNKYKCTNPRCITTVEQELAHVSKPTVKNGVYRCVYCDKETI